MRNYELILLLAAGFSVKTLVKDFGYSRSSVYRFNRILRIARKRIENLRISGYNGSPAKKREVSNLDVRRAESMRLAKREKRESRGKVEVWISNEI